MASPYNAQQPADEAEEEQVVYWDSNLHNLLLAGQMILFSVSLIHKSLN